MVGPKPAILQMSSRSRGGRSKLPQTDHSPGSLEAVSEQREEGTQTVCPQRNQLHWCEGSEAGG